MTTIILLPTNDGGYEYARIYRADSLSGEYSLIDTIDPVQLEYEDSDGDYSKYYKVAWYNGTTESTKIPVQSFVQKVINVIRIECKISASALPDSEIDYLVEQGKKLVQIDICKYTYGMQIYKLADGIYELPGRYYYDQNCGGAVSILDFELFKQATPITKYSEKITVVPLNVDPIEYWIKVPELDTTEILKVCYYTIGRDPKFLNINQLIAYKICAMYFENLYTTSVAVASSNPYSKVKIGPITIDNGTTSSSGTSVNAIRDMANKMASKYNDLVTKFKTGFVRVN